MKIYEILKSMKSMKIFENYLNFLWTLYTKYEHALQYTLIVIVEPYHHQFNNSIGYLWKSMNIFKNPLALCKYVNDEYLPFSWSCLIIKPTKKFIVFENLLKLWNLWKYLIKIFVFFVNIHNANDEYDEHL